MKVHNILVVVDDLLFKELLINSFKHVFGQTSFFLTFVPDEIVAIDEL
jgi:hypothetical protein